MIFFVSTSNTNLQFKSKYLQFTSYNPIAKVRATADNFMLFTIKKTSYQPTNQHALNYTCHTINVLLVDPKSFHI